MSVRRTARLHQDSPRDEVVRTGFVRAAPIVVSVLIGIAGWMVAAASGILSSGSRIIVFLAANLILNLDLLDLTVRVWLKAVHGAAPEGPSTDLGLLEISNAERAMGLGPYAIIASLHNAADDGDRFMAALLPFKDVVWLIDDASVDDTLMRFRQQDWRCLAGAVNRNKPGALAHLLKALPAEIQTVVIMDPDVRWVAPPGEERATLERVISDLQRSGAAALTPRVQARRGGWLVECQALEYELSCGLGRKSLRDLCPNSGVSIYRRSALERALSRHSLSIYAEDFENSLILLAAGERIYYDDRLIVETFAKRTWKRLLSQRVAWAFGCARVFVECPSLLLKIARRDPVGAYQYIFYLGIGGIVLLPLKWISIGILTLSLLKSIDDLLLLHLLPGRSWNEPILFAMWYCKSLATLLIACIVALPRSDRPRHLVTLPCYPFYALLQHIPTTIGYSSLLALKLWGKRLYVDHYDSGARTGRTVVAGSRSVEH